MTDSDSNSMNDQLSKPTPIFGLRLWVVMGISLGAAIVIVFFVLSLWLISKRAAATTSSAEIKQPQESQRPTIPTVTKSIPEIKIGDSNQAQSDPVSESGRVDGIERQALIEKQEEGNPGGFNKVQVEMVKGLKILCQDKFSGSGSSGRGEVRGGDQGPEVSHLGWGHWYTLRELEVATNGFCDQNVIGEGGYGIVYYGCLEDNTQVAVKNLLNNKGQAEKEFKVEVEAIGRVRHKGLVRLLGYCAEGAQRMLVYEYVNNGNLEQWLHGEVGPCSPLTWEIRMNIILGAAKGLTYLHEGLEPKVVHRDIKSSNILLDRQWNPKVSDFGLAKLLGSQKSYVTTRVMGTFGYVAPEYASSGMLTERSDVYSFGILVMEILSGRNPVDYNRPPGEVKLVDWLKMMVASKNPEGVLDPKLPEKPSSRELKRALLIALRCVDPNADKRPKMGQIVHMLEADESSYKDVRKSGRNLEKAHLDGLKEDSEEKS